ncbi:MAG TPA: hypothetical protein VFV40_05130 [Nocardioides sp.]|nr:hypothetical protein [Nocardioides sp.]
MTVPGPLLAAALVSLAVGLTLSTPLRRPSPEERSARRGGAGVAGGWAVGLAVGSVALGVATFLDGVQMTVALVGLGAVAGTLHLREQERRRRAAATTRAAVVELGEALVGELRTGRDVRTALDRAAGAWPPFVAVARAAALGADVPAALRRLAEQPGAEGLGDLAVAWGVAERTGSGLGDVLAEVVAGGRDVHEHLRTVSTELASARATARLMLLLPVVTLGLASGTGSDPWRLLVSDPVGVACLAGGTGLTLAGLVWVDRIADGVARR